MGKKYKNQQNHHDMLEDDDDELDSHGDLDDSNESTGVGTGGNLNQKKGMTRAKSGNDFDNPAVK